MYIKTYALLASSLMVLSASLCGIDVEKGIDKHEAQKIVLDAKVLSIIDGNFLDGRKVQEMYYLRGKIYDFLFGAKDETGTRVGSYFFDDKWCSLNDLLIAEEELDENSPHYEARKHALHALLEQSKAEFLRLSKKFSAESRSVKSVTIRLIEESCAKRGRHDSLLLKWGELTAANENEVFDNDILSFKDYTLFLTDLFNFLHDLSNSCPKAMKQFKDRIEKCATIQQLTPAAMAKLNVTIDQKSFIKAVKSHYLDTVKTDKITVDTVCDLIRQFLQKKSEPINEHAC